jgi:hypothetical protein
VARDVFFSFHYKPDNWRAGQVRGIGALDANEPVSDNTWESITDQGDAAIENWIAKEMAGRPCAIVLIGSATAGRKWVKYEIKKAWDDGMGLVGVHIHNLKDSAQQQSAKGANPFSSFDVSGTPLSSIVDAHDPPYSTSTNVYSYIADNIAAWVDDAISTRKSYS